MAWPFYFLLIALGAIGVRIASFWNKKARLFIQGRRGWKETLQSIPPPSTVRIWFHVSSLGEFEQARPVIETLKKESDADIVLTFFSPSGFEIRKDYPHARVMYLPLDLPGNANHWVQAIKPNLAVFVKYDLWPGYLEALIHENIPFILIAAHFKPGKGFSSWSMPLTASRLKKSKMIFLQNADHLPFIKAKGFNNLRVAGDTRVDRVVALPLEAVEKLSAYFKTAPPYDIVAGSTWPADERLLFHVIDTLHPRIIIAPHDISDSHIHWISSQLPIKHIRYSQIKDHQDYPIIVMDNIGMLAHLYACGRIAYIGGGFGKNIHNILEPMAHGKPVVFGPACQDFPEAAAIVKMRGGFVVQNEQDLVAVLSQLHGQAEIQAGMQSKNYIEQHRGATEIITRYIGESIPFSPQS